jgi:hypothetical protein
MGTRVIVTGSKTFEDYQFIRCKLDELLNDMKDVVILSGEETGIETLSEKYAVEKGLDISRFPINWDDHGRSAGIIRNGLMYGTADYAIIFWDGQKNSNTGYSVGAAKQYRVPYKIVRH